MASSSATCSTPPPPSSGICTPPTPKHGFSDHWDPFGPVPRKSARISSRQTSNRTPSPRSPRRKHNNSSEPSYYNTGSPRSARKSYNNNAQITSPVTSPRKKRVSNDSIRRASGTLTAESTATAAAALGFSDNSKMESRSGILSASARGAGLLPTPAKTPQERPSEANKVNVQKIARNLFHSDSEIMPKSKRTGDYVLDSFTTDNGDSSIEIYTDSHERIPEVDNSANNPFYGRGARAPPEPVKRRSPRNVHVPGEGEKSVDELAGSKKGMVFSFRGKRIFKEFPESDEAEDDEDVVIGDVEPRLQRPLTRSSIKPRLLFPPTTAAVHSTLNEDEEADTEVEDADSPNEEGPHTPEDSDPRISTPKAPKYAPMSPTSARATRSGASIPESTPQKPTRAKKRSPFEAWRVSKNSSAAQIHKRAGEPLGGEPKRTRT